MDPPRLGNERVLEPPPADTLTHPSSTHLSSQTFPRPLPQKTLIKGRGGEHEGGGEEEEEAFYFDGCYLVENAIRVD